ncbi:hypothetical protein [Hazenella coriacea]|uniref:Uncharacterized protein n=1 Tax=Hazenella coriacea TaxID=1179467 RepID=A0A4R3L765_9BACL|nr:hypothetical protein [Hazenella coriacea]TCS95489.1 hypothetical protein EDD58_10262 [Hazenella coriacea]
MSQRETQYDVIVIGTGESGRDAVEALKKDGKSALFIELKPEMVTTMVCQTPRQPVHDGHPSSEISEPIFIGDEQSHITLNQQTLHTANNKTTTSTLHVEELLELEQTTTFYPDEQQIHSHHTNLDIESSVHESHHELIAEEVEKHTNAPHVFLQERENTLRDKMMRRNTIHPFSEEPSSSEPTSFYQLDEFQKNESNQIPHEHWQEAQNTYIIDHEESSHEEAPVYEQPIYREREIRLRKRLVGGHRSSLLGTPEQSNWGLNEPPSWSMEQPPTHIPFSNVEPSSIESTIEPEIPESPSSPYYSESGVHPFSTRKRSRSHKKNLLKQNQPIPNEEMHSAIQPPSYPPALWEGPGFEGGNVNPNQPYDDFLFRNGPTSVQPFQSSPQEMPFQPFQQEAQPFQQEAQLSQPSQPSQPMQQELPFQRLQQDTTAFTSDVYEESPETNDSLKRDNIEFEDAYGGYRSWEEFLTPFSQNNRKRQEIDQIEKRKIALRGLHSLINNLG